MMQVSTIGFDLGKRVFQVHGVDAAGQVVLRRKLRRSQVAPFFTGLPPCLIGMEACGSAHYWARELIQLGHEARLMPPTYARAYAKRNKNDAIDAEACCEAVTRPSMRFVPVKSAAQQGVVVQHRARDLLVRQRTQQINALRGHLAEFGMIAAKGPGGVRELIELLHTAAEEALPAVARQALFELVEGIGKLQTQIQRLEKAILAANRESETARRLDTVPGIGPIGASAFAALVPDPGQFHAGRHFAAWLGITPRQEGTGGKLKLGRISKRGDRYLRRLLVLGATALLKRAKHMKGPLAAWMVKLLEAGKPPRLVTLAVANKLARIVWAVLVRGEAYRQPQANAA
jgi:transposase